MKIGNQNIGPGHPPYVIAEIGVNHDGEVSRALELTDAAADAGADAVKLQLFETDLLMSSAAKLAAYQKNAGETDPLAMLRRLELSIDEMAEVVHRAHEYGIHAIVTVFSVELVEVAERLPWDAYKSASPDIINRPLLEAMSATGKPLIVSTGASELDEVTRAAKWLDGIRDRLAFLQCVSSYPAFETALGGIKVIAEATGLVTGYSDHTKSHKTGRVAVAFGASILEKHLTDDRKRPGPDHAASLQDVQFGGYCRFAREGVALRAYVDKGYEDGVADMPKPAESPSGYFQQFVKYVKQQPSCGWEMLHEVHGAPLQKIVLGWELDVREVSRQSLVTVGPLNAGHTISTADLAIKRPGTGLPPYMLEEIVGRTLARDVELDVPLVEEDLA